MTSTVSIRLTERDRATLTELARSRGEGLSALLRGLAEREAEGARAAAIRAQTEAFMREARGDSALAVELAELSEPQVEALDSEAWWTAR